MKLAKTLAASLLITLLALFAFIDVFVSSATRNYLHAPAIAVEVAASQPVRYEALGEPGAPITAPNLQWNHPLSRTSAHHTAQLTPAATTALALRIYPPAFVYNSVRHNPQARIKNVRINGQLVAAHTLVSAPEPFVVQIGATNGFTLSFDAQRALLPANVLWAKVAVFFAMAFAVFGSVFGLFTRRIFAKFEFDIKWQHFSKNALLFGVIFVFLFCLNLNFFPVSDDILHFLHALERAQGGGGGFFDGVNARLGELLWRNVFARFALSPWFDAANAAMGASFFFLFFAAVFGRFPRDKADLLTFALIFGLVCYYGVFGSTFLWGAGSFNYLFSATLFFGFFAFVRYYYFTASAGGGGFGSGFAGGFGGGGANSNLSGFDTAFFRGMDGRNSNLAGTSASFAAQNSVQNPAQNQTQNAQNLTQNSVQNEQNSAQNFLQNPAQTAQNAFQTAQNSAQTAQNSARAATPSAQTPPSATPSTAKKLAIFAATSLIGFAAALSHEWLAAVMCVGVTLLILYFFYLRRNPMALIIAAFFVSAGFVLLMLAPGSEGKIELYRSAYGTEGFMTFKEIFALPLGKFFTKIYQTFNFLAQNDMLFCCVAILVLFWASKMLFFRAFGWRHWGLLVVIGVGVWLDEVCLMMVVGATALLADVWRVCGRRSVERAAFVWVAWLFMGLCLIQLEGTPLRARFLDTTLLVAIVAMLWREMVRDWTARAAEWGAGLGGDLGGNLAQDYAGFSAALGANSNLNTAQNSANFNGNSNLNLVQNAASLGENFSANSASLGTNSAQNPAQNSANLGLNLAQNAAIFDTNSNLNAAQTNGDFTPNSNLGAGGGADFGANLAQNGADFGTNSSVAGTDFNANFNKNSGANSSVAGANFRDQTPARLLPFAAKFEFALKLGAVLAFIVGTLYATANSYANGVLQLKLNALIQASARAGQADVVVPRTLSLPAGLGRFCDWAVLGGDPSAFPNDVYARFYGVKSVRVE